VKHIAAASVARLSVGLLIAALPLPHAATAVAAPAAAPAVPADKPPPDTIADSALFPDIQKSARQIDRRVRAALAIPTRGQEDWFPKAQIQEFGRFVNRQAEPKLARANFTNLTAQLRYFEETLARVQHSLSDLPVFTVDDPGGGFRPSPILYGVGDDATQASLTPAQATEMIVVAGTTVTRLAALKSLDNAIRPYQIAASWKPANDTRALLDKMAEDWDDYFEKGRPQSFLDVLATTLVHMRGQEYLTGPPATQYFLLHPNFVFEDVRAAPDGDQGKAAVAIEWVGINWWNARVPVGISLTSLYSDRPGVVDVGHGVCVYIANKYCVGWASHGGKNGFYFSLDALKLIDSKKTKLEQYRSQAAKYLGRN
jgi:hypothetical protein